MMKKIYTFLATLLIVGFAFAEGPYLIIDEDFSEWPLTQEEQPKEYMDWEYTTPNGVHLIFTNSRFTEQTANIVDVQPDNAKTEDEDHPGGMFFTVTNAIQIDVRFRSASNNNEEDRFLYLQKKNMFDEWEKISDDFPVTWGGSGEWAEVPLDEEITEETEFVVRGGRVEGGGGAVRIHGFRVWSNVPTSIDAASKTDVLVYVVPDSDQIRIEGDVVNVELYNLTGSLVYLSNERGSQGVSTVGLAKGVYIVKVTDGNGLNKVEKVVIN